jgi:hypothetical protein
MLRPEARLCGSSRRVSVPRQACKVETLYGIAKALGLDMAIGVDHTTIGRWLANVQMHIVDQSSPIPPCGRPSERHRLGIERHTGRRRPEPRLVTTKDQLPEAGFVDDVEVWITTLRGGSVGNSYGTLFIVVKRVYSVPLITLGLPRIPSEILRVLASEKVRANHHPVTTQPENLLGWTFHRHQAGSNNSQYICGSFRGARPGGG